MIEFYLPVWLNRYQNDEYFRLLECHYTFREVMETEVRDLVARVTRNYNGNFWIRVGRSGRVYYSWGESTKFFDEAGHSFITVSMGVV